MITHSSSGEIYNRELRPGLAFWEGEAGNQAKQEEKNDMNRGLHVAELVNERTCPI
jgi:hypothetical protein